LIAYTRWQGCCVHRTILEWFVSERKSLAWVTSSLRLFMEHGMAEPLALVVALTVLALICWIARNAYRAGARDAGERRQRQLAQARTPDWSTYMGQISGVGECDPMPGLFSLRVRGQPAGYTSVHLKRALADNFADAVGRGKMVVYTITNDGQLLGFTPIEEWHGPEIPLQGIHEKGATRLQPIHKNQFIGDFLRRQVENDPAYEDLKSY
jgi:hypothetical protein